MLVLFETAAGYALFKAKDAKLKNEDMSDLFKTPELASSIVCSFPSPSYFQKLTLHNISPNLGIAHSKLFSNILVYDSLRKKLLKILAQFSLSHGSDCGQRIGSI